MRHEQSLDRAAGHTLMVGLPGPHLDDEVRRRLREIAPGGVILFGRNLESPEQTMALIGELRHLLPDPTLIALDQEGGRVSRLKPFVGPTPPAASLARAGEPTIRRFAAATAAALRSLGFNLDFAPVVDLCDPTATNGIGDRSFDAAPGTATPLAGAFLDALQHAGVAGCVKHFPGLGATHVDSHDELPTATRTRGEIEGHELVPYRALAARAACVMVGHGHYPALDDTPDRPATLSPVIVRGLLRGELGYRGLVVTDDMEMGAVAPQDIAGVAAVQSMAAGCDLLLYCADLDRATLAREALLANAERNPRAATRLLDAAGSVVRTARRWSGPPPDADGWDRACRALRASVGGPPGGNPEHLT